MVASRISLLGFEMLLQRISDSKRLRNQANYLGGYIMKKALGFILAIVALLLLLVPYTGFLFLIAVVVAGVSLFFKIGPVILAGTFLVWAWKTYIAFALITIFCMTTFSYLHCCVGMNTFRGHIMHYGSRHLENLLLGLVWPVSWWMVDRNIGGWGLNWMDVVFGTLEFWLVTTWRGVRVDFVDMQSGEEETVYSKSPEESLSFVKDKIENSTSA
ncbi:MAG: hypothetical protein US63_C0011G0024 [Candidatus Moranbacteria bacterium GW2011_GWC2_37_8]|nr:MAG: hypothetical protein US63_C0011G0024 [Candidatus Moranbacteria bacterium GW2011_GWC2_37_8]